MTTAQREEARDGAAEAANANLVPYGISHAGS